MADQPQRTPLYEEHVRLGARMIPFGGWEMPVSYKSGIIAEHHATRRAAGLFDLSHMGEFFIQGGGASRLLDALLTNDAGSLATGHALYSPMCRDDGTIVDDVMLYRLPDGPSAGSPDAVPTYLLVVNASNRAKDLAWVDQVVTSQGLCDDVVVEDRSAATALIAVQGPCAASILSRLSAQPLEDIPRFGLRQLSIADIAVIAARTGYTGEDGFELFLTATDAMELWRRILEAGQPDGLLPVGLGARDTLRLEARLSLYGHDIDDTTTPLEAGLGWTVAWHKQAAFMGRAALLRQKTGGLPRRLAGLAMDDRAVPRQHCLVRSGGHDVGEVTSGTVSPILEKGIALAYLPPALTAVGTALSVVVRGTDHPAHVVKTPFYRAPKNME